MAQEDIYKKEPEENPKTGKLIITKSVDGGNITESEFEGALKFEVKTEDGKWLDKDGNVSDTKVELTLKDGGFVKGSDGKYTKTFENVPAGKYTVTETNSDVAGYKLVSNKSTTKAEATVGDGGEASADLVDVYEKDKQSQNDNSGNDSNNSGNGSDDSDDDSSNSSNSRSSSGSSSGTGSISGFGSAAKTGDTSPIMFYSILMMAALLIIIEELIRRRRRAAGDQNR